MSIAGFLHGFLQNCIELQRLFFRRRKRLNLDSQTAIGRYGDILLLQNKASPQGSPLSVLNASLVAAYMEERSNETLVGGIQPTSYIPQQNIGGVASTVRLLGQ